MMMKMMGRWTLVVTLLASGTFAATAEAPSNLLGDYVLLGLKSVTLRGRANVVSGDVGCNAPNGSVTLVDRAHVTGAVAANAIRMGRGTSAGGLFCTLLEQLAVKGGPATCVPAVAPLVDSAALPIVQATPGTQKVRLEKRVSLDPLPPGAYDSFQVAPGARLVLAGGEYSVRSIELRKRSQLLCTAACHISVLGRVRMGESSELGPIPPLDPASVRLDIKGEGPFPAFRALRRASVSANVYAPDGDVELGMNGKFTGAFVGERILVWPLARVEAASAL